MQTWTWTVLVPIISIQTLFFISKVGRLFAPKFYHEKRAKKIFKHFVQAEEHGPDKTRCEYPEAGRKY